MTTETYAAPTIVKVVADGLFQLYGDGPLINAKRFSVATRRDFVFKSDLFCAGRIIAIVSNRVNNGNGWFVLPVNGARHRYQQAKGKSNRLHVGASRTTYTKAHLAATGSKKLTQSIQINPQRVCSWSGRIRHLEKVAKPRRLRMSTAAQMAGCGGRGGFSIDALHACVSVAGWQPRSPLQGDRVLVEVLSFKNRDNLVRSRVDDENLIADQYEAVRPPFWINFNHSCRQWVQRYAARHYSAD